MGHGKTFVSFVLALKILKLNQHLYNGCEQKVLFVAPKTLISNFITEIKKFYGTTLKYEMVLKIDNDYVPDKDSQIIITTPSVLTKCYSNNKIDVLFMRKESVNINRYLKTEKIIYGRPEVPYLPKTYKTGTAYFYSTKFAAFFVDEVQKYTNVTTQRCQSLASICSDYRFMLSGTVFDEPNIERILGYHLILGSDTFPRNIPDAFELLHNENFKGINGSLIEFEQNQTKPLDIIVNKHIIKHELTVEEIKIYITMKNTISILKEFIKSSKTQYDKNAVRKFNSYLLSMITYIRQSIVCPLIPLSNVSLNILDIENKSELSVILNNQFKKLDLDNWLNKETSIVSSRITKIMEIISKHCNEKIVLFTCFKTSINIIEYIIKNVDTLIQEEYKKNIKGMTIYKITSPMDVDRRSQVIDDFNNHDITKSPCIILLSYELGAEGLNLQCASALLIVDFWWNISKSNQAIARIARDGQISNVNIYFFTSNTGIENSLFIKQQDKLLVLDEIKHGPIKTTIATMKMNEILKLIESNENIELVNKLHVNNK